MAKEKVEDVTFDKSCTNICSVGKLMSSKGYDRLVRITRKLLDAGLKIHTYVLGCGCDEQKIRDMIENNRLQDSFTLVGFRNNPYKYVAACDLYVCSSRIEGFSTAVTEALIVGTPVVSTNCSGAYELLGGHGEYGLVTQNDEESLFKGIIKMISETGLLNHYRKMAVERGTFFCLNKRLEEAEHLFMDILGR